MLRTPSGRPFEVLESKSATKLYFNLTGSLTKLSNNHSSTRITFGRLDNECISCYSSHGNCPKRNHAGDDVKDEAGRYPKDTHAGKLKGAILAQTPRGTFLTYVSMSLLTGVISALPHAHECNIHTFKLVTQKCGRCCDGSLDDLETPK
jgi:hypothetical protein